MAVYADRPPGDLNVDYRVNAGDLLILMEQWLMDSGPSGDLNASGWVDARDFAALARHWQETECPIVLNEVLAHSHAEASDWIELHNISSVPAHIGGWFLSDDERDLLKYEIGAGTMIEPNGYVVLYETTHFGSPYDPGARTPFALSENGETLFLFSADDPIFPNCLVTEPFGASETSHSFGRYGRSTGTYNLVTMSESTPGSANAYPLVGPIVISELMYHPASDGDAEYVELLNIGDGPVTLFDFETMEPWRFTDSLGIDLWLPFNVPVTLEAGEHLLLVRDKAAMREYAVPADVQVLEWSVGKLANQGETLQLLKPGDVDDQGTRYWIEVDRVVYSDGSHGEAFADGIDPWPIEADGFGLSLNRLFLSRYGNDPNNWHATIPTPGATND